MTVLKQALHLLELIEDLRYEDALTVIKSAIQEEKEKLNGFARDLIYKLAYSFGNEENPDGKILLVELFSLMSSAQEKYRLCYELLTFRTSPALTQILLDQLGSLIDTDFQTKHSKILTSKDEDIWHAVVESAHVLHFFDKIPFRVPYKFGRLVDRVLNELPMEELAAYPFLMWHAREHPFSPILLGHTEPTVLIPSVYDHGYLRLRLVEGMCEYLNGCDRPNDGSVKSLTSALRFLLDLHNNSEEIHACHMKLYSDMFFLLLQFIDDVDPGTHGVVIRAMLQDILSYFPLQSQVLLLKDVVTGITSKTLYSLKHKSKALAWLLDRFEHHLNEKVFMDELGSLLGILEDIAHDDIVGSRNFFASLLQVIRSSARNGAIEPESLKFRICFNFITGSFESKCPSEWQELCSSLPVVLEKELSDEHSTDILPTALDVAYILHSFGDIPFVIPERMSKVFTAAVNSTEPELPSAFPLLLFHSRTHPFSPKLLGVEDPTVLVPNVYSHYFRSRKLVEGLIVYLNENDYNYDKHFMKPIVTALDVIVKISERLNVSDIVLYSDLILRLLHLIEDFEQHTFRVPILNSCLDIIHKFSSCSRCLLIKHLISQVLNSDDLGLNNESAVVALFVDEYRKYLVEESFKKELGSFFGMLEDVRYENMCEASNYYVSIFTLVQLAALQRFNPTMLPEVKIRILDRVYKQITDYIQLEELRERGRADEKMTIPALPDGVFNVDIKSPFEGSVKDRMQLLLFSHEQAKQCISIVLS
ncbi:hypothetical protein KIN20_011593 [Parelaphostrongylus tenuis]|uniref:Uncharacterized protein n=1 Tax=Parelaphostrongylus tenuis TaxID=148309 RepID=A0AAD5MEA3_PARTN|nr:hypothetical protein KIN20_011593 [Parelaphostrongylus tenuis]